MQFLHFAVVLLIIVTMDWLSQNSTIHQLMRYLFQICMAIQTLSNSRYLMLGLQSVMNPGSHCVKNQRCPNIPPIPRDSPFAASVKKFKVSAETLSLMSTNGWFKPLSVDKRKLHHTWQSSLNSLSSLIWWWGFSSRWLNFEYMQWVNALPSTIALFKKFSKPVSCLLFTQN